MEKEPEKDFSSEQHQESRVVIGSTVTVEQDGGSFQVLIFSEDIKDPMNDDVFHASFESAVGAALLGKKVGDLVTYQTPNGKNLSMTIKAIENT